ncbi:MAG: hypothetical protein HC914_02650 [Chloroflexaceae bacterium]|nr:hypothetical protein [Chloroflexaceae bacterium]
MTSPLVTIVILHWRGAAKTLHCLERVQQLDYAPYHVILVDNGALPAEWRRSVQHTRLPRCW